jgi:hypothetical protein
LFKRPCNLLFSVGFSTTLLARFLSSDTVPVTFIAVASSVGASFALLDDETPALLESVEVELDCELEVVAVEESDEVAVLVPVEAVAVEESDEVAVLVPVEAVAVDVSPEKGVEVEDC